MAPIALLKVGKDPTTEPPLQLSNTFCHHLSLPVEVLHSGKLHNH